MYWKIGLIALLWLPLGGCAEPPRAEYDHYLLALSVAPAFCEDEPQRKRGYAQCNTLSEGGFKAMPLTLHGLWPNRLDRKHPVWCGGELRGAFCTLPAIKLPPDTRVKLERAMPAMADCLDRYQWAKHGRCAGLDAATYFAAAAALTERLNRAIGDEVAAHAGREVSLAFLREALAEADPTLKDAVTFDCRTPRTPDPAKRRPMLREVRVYFERDSTTGAPGRPLAFARAGVKHHNSGCPAGMAYIDSALD